MPDFEELGRHLHSVVGELEDLSNRLTAATETALSQEFRVTDADGLAEVTVDGRPRVVGFSLHPRALDMSAEQLDQVLTALVNDALGKARSATRQTLFEALPEPVRAEVEDATEGGRAQ
jgi:DNA-binding protein YbaB